MYCQQRDQLWLKTEKGEGGGSQCNQKGGWIVERLESQVTLRCVRTRVGTVQNPEATCRP
jgi:hypothetical protein